MTGVAPDTLFDRSVTVKVAELQVTGLRVAFNIDRNLSKDPNTATIRIYNLSEEHRNAIEEAEAWFGGGVAEMPISLSAGYIGRETQLFLGSVRSASSSPSASGSWVTTLEASDGLRQYQSSRKKTGRSHRKNVSLKRAIELLARDLDVGLGNVVQAIRDGKIADLGATFKTGITSGGMAQYELDRLLQSAGLEWSIQDGEIQAVPVGSAATSEAVLLKRDTGLVGVPEVNSDGSLEAVGLIQPDLVPGNLVKVQSGRVIGQWRIRRGRYTGDTESQDWYARIEGTPT